MTILTDDTWKTYESCLIDGTGRFDLLTTQITQVFSLNYGLVPEEEKDEAFDVLISEILKTHKGHLSTGIFGTKMLYDVLRLEKRNDLAYLITNQKDYPGYINMLDKGATTLWEQWDFQGQNSLDHPIFGSVSEWFFRSLTGINPDRDAIGFDKVKIKPFIPADLQYTESIYKSIKDQITSSWRKEGDKVKMMIKIPANISARLFIPTKDPHLVMVNDVSALSNNDLEFIEFDGSCAIFKTGKGSFDINTEL